MIHKESNKGKDNTRTSAVFGLKDGSQIISEWDEIELWIYQSKAGVAL
jgi:hypothetical protein